MSSSAFEEIKQSLLDAIDHVNGKDVGAIIHEPKPVDVQAIRESLGMDMTEFSRSIGVRRETVRRWERGERQPRGPALVLLRVLEKEPGAGLRAMGFRGVADADSRYSK